MNGGKMGCTLKTEWVGVRLTTKTALSQDLKEVRSEPNLTFLVIFTSY